MGCAVLAVLSAGQRKLTEHNAPQSARPHQTECVALPLLLPADQRRRTEQNAPRSARAHGTECIVLAPALCALRSIDSIVTGAAAACRTARAALEAWLRIHKGHPSFAA